MVGQNKVVNLSAKRTPAPGINLLDELSGLAQTRLDTLLGQAFDQVDDALFDRAEKAGTNSDQAMFFATMRQVRLHRRTVAQTFGAGMENAFTQLTQTASSGAREAAVAERGGYSLELMDEAIEEERVAADTMVGKIRTRCALPLAQLVTRLNDFVVERSVDERNNPLDPRQIVDAFDAALESFDIEIQPKLIIFKLFEKQALQELPALYEAANQLLMDAGVLPKLRGTEKPSATGATQSSSNDPQPSAASIRGSGEEEEGDTSLELLQQLLTHARGGEPAQPAARAAAGVSRSDVLQALSALQLQPRETAGTNTAQALNGEELKGLLGRSLHVESSGVSRRIEHAADDTIDIVSMLFDVILDDSRLAPSIKAIIARLQIPVVKVAMLDRSFFSNRQHPARALINELAHAAVGWAEPENPDADPLYCKISEVLNRILEGFESDTVVFERVLQDFRQFLEQEKERAQAVEARTRQAAEGKAKVEDARERVQAEIERRLRGEPVPEIARQILEQAWFKVLFITCVKEGPQGEAWESQLELMDRLIWSVRPKADPEERQRLLTAIPALLNDLREGLNAILYNPCEMTRLFKELEAEHIRCLSATTAEQPAPVAQPASETGTAEPEPTSYHSPDEPSAADEAPSLTEEQRLREEYLERLATVDLGTWFAFSNDGEHQLRAKLSARLNRGYRLIFVNRAGFKLADKQTEAVAEELSTGQAFILDHNMLFDKALEQVITNLRDLRAAGEEL